VSSAKILIVDDAQQVRRVLRTALSAEGYTIFEAGTGEEALESVRQSTPDAILLDVNMPGIGGLETCREIRRTMDIPILMLTVRNAERDKVMALDAGADDYVVKPFSMAELLARIRAALRRRLPQEKVTSFSTKDFAVNFETRQVTVKGRDVHLTPKEFELLRHLTSNAGKPITHRRLLQAVWGPDYGDEPEYLRVMINQLRKKIESDPGRPKLILTEPWVGYRFQAPREPRAAKQDKEE
jgi:two-component system, OmpR family, KDP operon response regulator KdpE